MPITYLTREGYDKLQEELDYLSKTKRNEVAERLHDAMDGGELIENAEYEAAKNEQSFVEGRIKELEIILATARVVEEDDRNDEVIHVGSKVTITEVGSKDKEKYQIVGAAEADPAEGKISNESPLGRALMNKKKGDKVKVDAPAGCFEITVVKVE